MGLEKGLIKHKGTTLCVVPLYVELLFGSGD